LEVGLFFGSFNPVHIGHMIIANHLAQFTDLEEIWMVLSPQNPLKHKASLANNNDRYHLLQLAIGSNPLIKASNIEFKLPVPSFTVDTLAYLKEKFPIHTFSLIMGEDNLETIEKWKNYEFLLANYTIYLYPRPGYQAAHKYLDLPTIIKVDAPKLEISATSIRSMIKEDKSVQYLVPDDVYIYLKQSPMYR